MLLSLHPPSSVPFSYSPPPGSSPLPSNCSNMLIPREPPTGGRGESPNHRTFHVCNCGFLQPAYRGNKASVPDDAPLPSSKQKVSHGFFFSDKPLAFSPTTPAFTRRALTSRRLRPRTVAIPWSGSVWMTGNHQPFESRSRSSRSLSRDLALSASMLDQKCPSLDVALVR